MLMHKRVIVGTLLLLLIVPIVCFSQTLPDASKQSGNANVQAQKIQEENDSFFSRVFGQEPAVIPVNKDESWLVIISRIIQRLSLAALLAAILAKRPRKQLSILHLDNPYMAQTHILLAVVASSLMMVVGDSAARAFGIFAAASLVRFRTNVRDPKEITILLISLAIGLATGVGRWELAVILTLFILPLLWILEFQEPLQVHRSMELKIRTKDIENTQQLVRELFRKHNIISETRTIKPGDEKDPNHLLVYYIGINLSVTTDQLNEEILSLDTGNVASIEWDQKKTTSYIYQ
jgi:uncharacterized membrane protein YhiD involved in acid resistance